MLNIETKHTAKTAFLHLGFRPFFFAAISFGLISIALWLAMYTFGKGLLPNSYPLFSWHAHEMIFGFTTAIITGFLLTAVKNWTGIQTINGKPLLGLFLLWLFSRVLAFYIHLIGLSQVLWILAFLIFFIVYAPMLIKARIDGRPG